MRPGEVPRSGTPAPTRALAHVGRRRRRAKRPKRPIWRHPWRRRFSAAAPTGLLLLPISAPAPFWAPGSRAAAAAAAFWCLPVLHATVHASVLDALLLHVGAARRRLVQRAAKVLLGRSQPLHFPPTCVRENKRAKKKEHFKSTSCS